jgi:hypothetical protein
MKKIVSLFILVFMMGLSSCVNYQNVSHRPRVTHILAVNELGQQVQVPLSTFSGGLDPYYYNNWRFYWGNNWYYGNNWWFYFNDPYWRPRIHNYYYSHPVYYNQGFRVARNNGYRGREYRRDETPSVRPRQEERTATPPVRSQRTETPSVRPQSGGRGTSSTSSGRRGS